MTASDPRRRDSPVERALDLFVYLPAGAVLTALEDAPGMVTKGRRRVDQELRNARVVGRFAVQLGARRFRNQVNRFVADQQRPESRDRAPGTATPAPGTAREVAPEPAAPPRRPEPTPQRPSATRPPTAPRRRAQGPGTAPPAGPARGGRDAAVDRAIPEYDTLSASQVVRRLDGLSEPELRAVVQHEQTNRARRTVLSRADQLLGRRGSTGGGGRLGR